MSIDKSILLQKQVRNNTEDLRAYLNDLVLWEEEMKRKESDLKEENVDVQAAESKSQKTLHNKNSGKGKGTSKKITGSDYTAWDKLDVEAKCAKMEVNKKDEYDSSDNEEDYIAKHIALRRDESLYEKERGNHCVRLQKWDDAIACYTKAIACFSNDPIYFANRALCYLKKNDFKSAETDCISALQLNPTYVKALQRRAAAKVGLEQYEEAIIDLKRVLEFEPHNTESKNQLLRVEKCLGSNKQAVSNKVDPVKKSADNDILNVKPSTSKSSVFESPPVKEIPWPNREFATLIEPVEKLPHQRSKKPLRRIEILESDSSEIVLRPLRSENELKNAKNEPRNIDYSDSNALATILAQSEINIEDILKGIDKLKYTISAASSKVELDYSGLSESANAEKKSELSKTDTVKTTEKPVSDIGTGIASNTISNQNNKAALNSIEKNEEIFHFKPPNTSLQFYCSWRAMKNNTDHKFMYLQKLNPTDLPKILQEYLECDIISEIIHILKDRYIKNNLDVYSYLLSLSKIRRFSTLIMFASHEDKLALNALFDYCIATANISIDIINKLKKDYEL